MQKQLVIDDVKNFSNIRIFLWPFHRFELLKFLPLLFLYILLIFLEIPLKTVKDTFIIINQGTEFLVYLKSFMPFVYVFFFLFFLIMMNLLNRKKFVFSTIGFFSLSLFITVFILIPNADNLHLKEEYLVSFVGTNPLLKIPMSLLSYWTYSLFYFLVSMWGAFSFSFLFWMFANEFTTVHEGKRFYPFLIWFGNVFGILPGVLLVSFLSNNSIEIIEMLKIFMFIFGIILFFMLFCILYLEKNFNKVTFKDEKKVSNLLKKLGHKPSYYLFLISLIVIIPSVVYGFFDLSWKFAFKSYYSVPSNYAVSFEATSFISLLLLIPTFCFLGFLRHFGWYITSMFVPILFLVSSCIYYIFIILIVSGMFKLLFAEVIFSTIFGSIFYTILLNTFWLVYLPAKELVYIPLSSKIKANGKLIIDFFLLGLAKSLKGLIALLVFVFVVNSVIASIYFFVVSIILIMIWIWSIKKLNPLFKALTEFSG